MPIKCLLNARMRKTLHLTWAQDYRSGPDPGLPAQAWERAQGCPGPGPHSQKLVNTKTHKNTNQRWSHKNQTCN